MTAVPVSSVDAHWGAGSAVGTAFSTLFGHFFQFVGTALVIRLPALILELAVPASLEVPASYVSGLVDLIFGQIVTVALVYGTVQALRGRQVSMVECVSQGLKRLGTAIGVVFLTGLGVAAGTLLLIVPGIILYVMWSVAIPVATIERIGVTASMSRSAQLTKGRRLRICGALGVVGVVTGIAQSVIMGVVTIGVGLTGVADSSRTVLSVVSAVQWSLGGIISASVACLVATLYYFLRREREGVDIEQIASVFD